MTALTIAARASLPARLKVHLAPSYEERPLKVLCATDLWASSDFAVQRALTLAETADARLLLLHVVDEDAPLRILGRRAERASRTTTKMRAHKILNFEPVRQGNAIAAGHAAHATADASKMCSREMSMGLCARR